MNSQTYLDAFLAAYIACALWSSTDNADDSGGQPGYLYGPEDIEEKSLESMREDCVSFIEGARPYLGEWTAEQAGHDFWLTRNGHGAGFWDRGKEHGDTLTRMAHAYGSVDLYVDDDGKVYA